VHLFLKLQVFPFKRMSQKDSLAKAEGKKYRVGQEVVLCSVQKMGHSPRTDMRDKGEKQSTDH
jgi:hypothetical protein